MISGKAIAEDADLIRPPARSGQYGADEFDQDRFSYSQVDSYWDAGNLPAVRKVPMIVVGDNNTRAATLQSGQVRVDIRSLAVARSD